MKLDATKLAIATAAVVAVSWVICSLLVISAPTLTLQMSGQMMHTNLQMGMWALDWNGFFVGLVAWSIIAAAYVWAVVTFYNRLVK